MNFGNVKDLKKRRFFSKTPWKQNVPTVATENVGVGINNPLKFTFSLFCVSFIHKSEHYFFLPLSITLLLTISVEMLSLRLSARSAVCRSWFQPVAGRGKEKSFIHKANLNLFAPDLNLDVADMQAANHIFGVRTRSFQNVSIKRRNTWFRPVLMLWRGYNGNAKQFPR